MGFRDRGIEIKTAEQIDKMRVAGRLVGETLELLRDAARPGVTTKALDSLAETNIRDHAGVPSFLGYGVPPFPASICASVNDEVVHGIPGPRTLAEGDVISIDCGAIVDGWHGDAAITVPIGEVTDGVRELLRVTEESLSAGHGRGTPGVVGSPTSATAIESYVRDQGRYGILEDYTGHGIGTEMHMAPNVPNYGRRGRGPAIVEGLALAGADGDARQQAHRPPRGRVDGGHRRRVRGGALRAHLHRHPDGRVGAHRRRRWRGSPGRAGRPVRRTLSERFHVRRCARGTLWAQEGNIPP